MEDFVIDEIHTAKGWRIANLDLRIVVYATERSDANRVVELLNAGLRAEQPVPEPKQGAYAADQITKLTLVHDAGGPALVDPAAAALLDQE